MHTRQDFYQGIHLSGAVPMDGDTQNRRFVEKQKCNTFVHGIGRMLRCNIGGTFRPSRSLNGGQVP